MADKILAEQYNAIKAKIWSFQDTLGQTRWSTDQTSTGQIMSASGINSLGAKITELADYVNTGCNSHYATRNQARDSSYNNSINATYNSGKYAGYNSTYNKNQSSYAGKPLNPLSIKDSQNDGSAGSGGHPNDINYYRYTEIGEGWTLGNTYNDDSNWDTVRYQYGCYSRDTARYIARNTSVKVAYKSTQYDTKYTSYRSSRDGTYDYANFMTYNAGDHAGNKAGYKNANWTSYNTTYKATDRDGHHSTWLSANKMSDYTTYHATQCSGEKGAHYITFNSSQYATYNGALCNTKHTHLLSDHSTYDSAAYVSYDYSYNGANHGTYKSGYKGTNNATNHSTNYGTRNTTYKSGYKSTAKIMYKSST